MNHPLMTESEKPSVETLFRNLHQQIQDQGFMDAAVFRDTAFRLAKESLGWHLRVEEDDESVTLYAFYAYKFVRRKDTGEIQAFEHKRVSSGYLEELIQHPFEERLKRVVADMKDSTAQAWLPQKYCTVNVFGYQCLKQIIHLEHTASNCYIQLLTGLLTGCDYLESWPGFNNQTAAAKKSLLQNLSILRNTLMGSYPRMNRAKSVFARFYEHVVDSRIKPYIPKLAIGFAMTTLYYNHIARNLSDVRKRMEESPSLTPVAAYWNYKRVVLTTAVQKGPDAFKENSFSDDLLKRFKAHLQDTQDLSESGWRWLSKQPTSLVSASHGSSRSTSFLADTMGQFKLSMPTTLFRDLLQNWSRLLYWMVEHSSPEVKLAFRYILRAVTQEAIARRKAGKLKAFLRDDLAFVRDWLSSLEPSDYARLPTKDLTFRVLQRKQEAWHEQMLKEKSQTAKEWPKTLEEPLKLSTELYLEELCDSASLYQEGRLMHHCVGSYDKKCAEGHARIFSIRKHGSKRPEATLELYSDSMGAKTDWRTLQVRGVCNADVDASVEKHAKKFAKTFNRLWAEKLQSEGELLKLAA